MGTKKDKKMQGTKQQKTKTIVFVSFNDTLVENNLNTEFLKELIPKAKWHKQWLKNVWEGFVEGLSGKSPDYRKLETFKAAPYLKNVKSPSDAQMWFSWYAYASSVKKHVYKDLLDGKKSAQLDGVVKKIIKGLRFREGAIKSIQHHKELGHFVVLVSSGLDLYMKPIAKKLGVDALVCTRMQEYHGFINGTMEGPECIYEQKIEELKFHGLLPWLHEMKKKNGFESGESFYEKDRVLTAREQNAKAVKESFYKWYYEQEAEDAAPEEEGVIEGSPIEEEESVKVRAARALKEKQKEERWRAIKCRVVCYGSGKKDMLLMTLASGSKESFFEPFRKVEATKGIKKLVKKT